MLRRLAGLFSGLTLLVFLAAIWVSIPRPPPPVPAVPLAPLVGPVSRILVEKSARRMTVFVGDQVARIYRVRLGFAPEAPKTRQGDGRTPEGQFRIDRRNAASAYHLSLGINYPRPQDRAQAAALGVSPGGDIFLHGQPNQLPAGTLGYDWTAGCIALSNAEIEELFAATPIGAAVEIRP
ncbi:MAG: L,D-transpeptidase [Paracoccaceae bacterium]|nr:L,D-transpeptidase [Paracoccaceae bacterium]